ncbi:MAG: hypothetical protein LBQ16_00105 [Gracilibacteraceae bacterium]|jgi:hypothetical protein|nr:hypothetical protein [Gracilibacteraceae bacterium]
MSIIVNNSVSAWASAWEAVLFAKKTASEAASELTGIEQTPPPSPSATDAEPLSEEEAERMAQILSEYQYFFGPRAHRDAVTGLWTIEPFPTIVWESDADSAFERRWLKYANNYIEQYGRAGMDREEYRAYLQENGLGFSAEEYWLGENMLLYLRTMPKISPQNLSREYIIESPLANVSESMHDLASQYAYDRSQFMAHYEGEELEAHLQRLDKYFALKAEHLAASKANNFAVHAEIYGLADEAGAIKDSILAITLELAGRYADFTGQNPDYAGISGTEDAWLKDDKEFMTYQLRQAFAAQSPETGAAAGGNTGDSDAVLYSEAELTYLGRFLAELDREMQGAVIADSSEAGFTWGLAALKAEAVMRQAGVSDNLRPLLERAAAEFGAAYMDAIDEFNRRNSEKTFWNGIRLASFQPLDRAKIMAVCRAMMDKFAASGDFAQAMRSGSETWKAIYSPSPYSSPANNAGSRPADGPTAGQLINLQWDYFMHYLQTGENIIPYGYGALDAYYQTAMTYGKQLDIRI